MSIVNWEQRDFAQVAIVDKLLDSVNQSTRKSMVEGMSREGEISFTSTFFKAKKRLGDYLTIKMCVCTLLHTVTKI